jgi:hypothetical protein
MTEPCPHCNTRAKHGERIGCCSGCGELFASMSAFDRHRKALTCIWPHSVGLVPKQPKTDPDATMWALPGGYSHKETP